MLTCKMALRERNAFLVKARGRERAHGLSLHVNIREQDLGYFNDQQAGGSAPGAVQVRQSHTPRYATQLTIYHFL